jgi:hypothetical protein
MATPPGRSSPSVPVEQLSDLIKSLGGDYKWMKDAEIEEMAHISSSELAFVRGVLSLPEQVSVFMTPE